MNRNEAVSIIRKKYNMHASIKCIQNIKNEQWITEMFHVLHLGDHALICEYCPNSILKNKSLNVLFSAIQFKNI